MSNQYFNMDTKDFELRFQKLVNRTIPSLASKGMFKAAGEALRDSDKEAPQTPKDSGDLIGSKRIELAKTSFKDVNIKFGFNIEYASRVHENESLNFKVKHAAIPSPGAKFLESKLGRHAHKYMGIVALVISRGGFGR